MKPSENLSSIEKVALREVWLNEAQDFTPWLAEHLSELGEALGLDLELEAREAPVGGYSLDILARDQGSDGPVVIENQLESTDHTHLGQLLTYAAGFDAHVIVWIAKEFRDEHREALNLLNHRTGEDTQFFGVEVELWKIDDSRPAVNFKLVATPNEWQKQARATSEVSERNDRYRTFFQKLIDTLREEHQFTRMRKAQPKKSACRFSTGHRGISYDSAFRREETAMVDVYIDNGDRDWNKNLFDKLQEDKEAIESELAESLKWDRLDNRRASRIAVVRPGSIDDDEEMLGEVHDWMVEKLLAFKRVFGPRLDELVQQ